MKFSGNKSTATNHIEWTGIWRYHLEMTKGLPTVINKTDAEDESTAKLNNAYENSWDEFVLIFEAHWKVSKNPVFAWAAVPLLLHPNRPGKVLPAWVSEYLFRAGSNLAPVMFEVAPEESPSLIGRALGLTADKRSPIKDARTLWQAPIFVGIYESLFEQAVGPRRAEATRSQMRERFDLQSNEAVRGRLDEARRMVKALLLARGHSTDKMTMSLNCREVMDTQINILKYLEMKQVNLDKLTVQTLKAVFTPPRPVRDAIDAALRAARPAGKKSASQ